MVLGLLAWLSLYHIVQRFTGKPYVEEIFMTVFEFIGQFFFQNYVFKLQEVFPEHGNRVFHELELGSF
jgi:hypothetical protein